MDNTEERKAYSRRELLAGMQMLEWALTQMYVHGTGGEALIRSELEGDVEAERGLRLIRMTIEKGHHWFRDQIADLVGPHAEGQRLGLEGARIVDYRRSHDVVWTECFMNFCCELTDEGFRLKPDWQSTAMVIWTNFAGEIEAGELPDLEAMDERKARAARFQDD